MSIKQNGGVFGRNPTFNDVTIEGDLIINGEVFTGLDFQGSWNASTNSPSLASSTGTNGEFYIVSVAGTTNLNGITNWGIGDWAIFNGTVWQRVEGGADGNFDALTANSLTINGADAVGIDDYILHNGDNDTKFGFSGNDAWKVRTGGVDAVTVDASQNVNIPAGNLTIGGVDLNITGNINHIGDGDTFFGFNANDSWRVVTGNAEGLKVDASQNVSIPNGSLSVGGGNITTPQDGAIQMATVTSASGDLWTGINTGANAYASMPSELSIINTADNTTNSFSGVFFQAGENSAGVGINSARIGAIRTGSINTDLAFATRGTGGMVEAMRIDSSQNVLVGKQSASFSTVGHEFRKGSAAIFGRDGGEPLVLNRISSDGTILRFSKDNGQVGSVSVTGSATSYNTSSDYRLKEDVQPLSGATDRLKELKPVNFAWKVDGSRVDGFLAHEAQEVVPESVTGSKDAMMTEEYEVTPAVTDEEGNVTTEAVMGEREVPDYQGIDQAKLVPLLVATIQELEARITALES